MEGQLHLMVFHEGRQRGAEAVIARPDSLIVKGKNVPSRVIFFQTVWASYLRVRYCSSQSSLVSVDQRERFKTKLACALWTIPSCTIAFMAA